MRSVQLLGLICSFAAFALLYWALAPITSQSSGTATSASGLVLMFLFVPLLGFSALLQIPSSLALICGKLRANSYFVGNFWYCIWGLNCFISLGYFIVAIYLAYIYLVTSMVS